ncbi:hypothetical protein HTV45_29185 [Streptomyces sp. CHD11]|uniref:hypothetical protein n=1 Tax=Streptomyces sp. CHD11 TaxID=2741325 RepID=UPI001BFC30E5|nr:hypothetical protein [Streptomyces sp. CHD11]MBT3154897.1 hypothetical protein [Streptomyces sp. CHD11]
MTHVRHRQLIAATLTAVALVAGCQNGSETSPLSLKGLTETADGVPDDGASTCPLPYDIAEAAKTSGLDGRTGLGPVEDDDTPVATGEGGERAEPGEPLAENPGALVSCTFHIGQDDVHVHTIATRKPNAINYLAPVISPLTGTSIDESLAYISQAADAEAGEVDITSSGSVASVRLELDGQGDAALLVGAGQSGDTSLSRKQLENLTKELAGQVQ